MSVFRGLTKATIFAVATGTAAALPTPSKADCELVCSNGESRLITTLRRSSTTDQQCVNAARHWAGQGGKLAAMMNRAGSCNITINCGAGRETVGHTSGTNVYFGQRKPC